MLFCPFRVAAQKKEEHQRKIACPPIPHPRLTLQVRPKYPKQAKLSGIEGRVSMHLLVGADGSVLEMEVIRGEEPFVQAAKTAVAQWKYQPVVVNEVAVESDTTVEFVFEIPKQKSSRTDSPATRSSLQE
jgi:TonB family protein